MELPSELVVILSSLPAVFHGIHLGTASRKFTDDNAVGMVHEKRPHLLCPQMPRRFVDEIHESVILCEQFFRIGNEGVAIAGGVLSKTLAAIIGNGAKHTRFPFRARYRNTRPCSFLGEHFLDRNLILEECLILRNNGVAARFPARPGCRVLLLKKRFVLSEEPDGRSGDGA